MSRLPPETREKAFNLRSKGYSVKEIADKLYITKSTASLWVRQIKLNKKAQQRLMKRRLLGYYKAGLYWERKRDMEIKKYESAARKVIDKIKKDPNHTKIYCALLYWCEGGKSPEFEISFINSNPILIKTFINLFRQSFALDERKFRALMHLHDYHDEVKQKEYWSKITGISSDLFQKTYYKFHTGKRIREGYPGCIAIRYYDSKIAKELKVLYKVFSEQMGM